MLNATREFVNRNRNPIACLLAVVGVGLIFDGLRVPHRPTTDDGRMLYLGQDGFDALINGDADFIHFVHDKHPHVFRVTLEQ